MSKSVIAAARRTGQNEAGSRGMWNSSRDRRFMQSTRISLLSAASSGTEQAWDRLVELYRPLIFGWLLRHDVSHHDAEDLSQDVMAVVVRELPNFSHCGSTGAFRNWLRTITANRAKGFWRAGKIRPAASGRSSFLVMIEQLEDEHSQASKLWNREHDAHVLRRTAYFHRTGVRTVHVSGISPPGLRRSSG